jgi:hypothetical protein
VLGGLLANGNSGAVIDDLYQRALARKPSAVQRDRILSYVAAELEAGRARRRVFENVLWAILNSKEFQLNQ